MNTYDEHPTILLNYIPEDYAAAYQQFWLGQKFRNRSMINVDLKIFASLFSTR